MSRIPFIHGSGMTSSVTITFEPHIERHALLGFMLEFSHVWEATWTEVDLFSVDPSTPTRIHRVKAYLSQPMTIAYRGMIDNLVNRIGDISQLNRVLVSDAWTGREGLEIFTPLV